jgi:hypothetical protein
MADTREALEKHVGELYDERSELDVDLDEIRPSSAEENDTETVLGSEIESVDARPDAPEERQDEAGPDPAQPFHSVRADAPGPKGCWALARSTGQPCSAAAVKGSEFCAAHSGLGLSGNPSLYSPIGQAALREQRALRATMRAMYGSTRANSPRAVLRAHVNRQAERIVGRAVNAVLSPTVPDEKAGKLALELIREADPLVQAEISVSGKLPQTDEELQAAFADGSILGLIRAGAYTEQGP